MLGGKVNPSTNCIYFKVLAGVGFLLAHLCGCSTKPAEYPVLATVGNEQIEVAEFQIFSASIPESMKEGSTPLEIDRELLESQIDKRILLMEARAMDIGDDPRFRRKITQYERTLLFDLYRDRAVRSQIVITEQEREEHYRRTHRDRALRFSGIMLKTEDDALQVLAELEAGGDFQQLAQERSVHRETGARGGDSGVYMTKDQVEKTIADHIYHLETGAVSNPVPMGHAGQVHYVIFKILDEMPVPLRAAEEIVYQELLTAKIDQRRAAVIDSLRKVYNPRLQRDKIALITRMVPDLADADFMPPQAESKEIICLYEGGQVTIEDFFLTVQEAQVDYRSLQDSVQVASIIERMIVPQNIVMAAARSAGLDRDPGLRKKLEAKRQELLASVLRWRQIDQHLTVSDEEARAFYEANPKKFTSPETATIIEILVAADSLAQRLQEELQETQDPQRLAQQYTRREESGHHGARLKLNMYTQNLYPRIYEAVQSLEVGEVGGPIKVEEGYSVFKVEERTRETYPYDDNSQRRAQAYVKIDKARNGYVNYVRGLRQKYPVAIFEENLARMHQLQKGDVVDKI